MSDDNVRDLNLPPEEVDLDLDTVEKDEKDVKPPYRTRVAGRILTFGNPEDVDWQDLLLIQSPVDLLQFVLNTEDLRFLREQHLPGWKLGKLMNGFSEHYDLDERMRQAQRQQALAERSGR